MGSPFCITGAFEIEIMIYYGYFTEIFRKSKSVVKGKL